MKIDWDDLREQKSDLYELISTGKAPTKKQLGSLQSLLHLVDGLQDEAVNSGNFDEEEVFGEPVKEEDE